MCRISSLTLLAATVLNAQTTVYLRTGEPGSFHQISGATNATPVVVTTKTAHGFQDGDLVSIQQVYGNWAANGVRKVTGATAKTFALATLDGQPVAGDGNYQHSGIVGKVTPHTLKPHPRMMLDGPDGAITAAVRGRDQNGYAPWEALKQLADAATSLTPARRTGPNAFLSALGWQMDSSKTAWLNSARTMINEVEKALLDGTTSLSFFPGPFSASSLGRGSDVDWASHNAVPYAFAYSVIRDQLNGQERRAFADKLLNNSTDYGESCTPPLTWLSGRVTTTSGSKNITGEGTRFSSIQPGSLIMTLAPHQGLMNIPGRWFKVASVENDGSLTVENAAANNHSNAMIAVVRAWQPGDCGWRWYVRQHPYSPMFDRRRFRFTLSAPVSPGDTQITVSEAPAKRPPYYIGGGIVSANKYFDEIMRVTAQEGNVLTVERGALNTTPLTIPAGRAFFAADPEENFTVVSSKFDPPVETIPFDDPRHNLVLAKLYGYFMVGLALADEDERARLMFEQAYNYWFDAVLPYNRRSWTGVTQSAGNPGYNRRHLWNAVMAWAAKHSLSPSADVTGGEWLRNTLSYFPAMELPGRNYGVWPFSDAQMDTDFALRHLEGVLLSLAFFPEDPRAQKFNWWLRTRKNLWSRSVFTQAPEMLMYALFLPGPGEVQIGQIDYTATDPPHFTLNRVDLNDGKQSPISVWHSRTDWSDNATSVFALAVSRPNDHTGQYPGPGAYRIRKGNTFLAGDAGPVVNNTGNRQWSNYLQIGTTHTPGTGFPLMDRSDGNSQYAYVRINNSNTYPAATGTTRAYRHLLHLKGAIDSVIAYDEVATAPGQAKTARFWFYSDNYETPALELNGCSAVYKRPSAQLVTRFLLPAGASCRTAFVEGNVYAPGRFKLNGIVLDAGSEPETRLLAVHKGFNNTYEEMPPSTLLSGGPPSHEGVLLEGPSPVLALFPKNSHLPSASISLTAPFSNMGTVYVAGMAPGEYQVAGAPGEPQSVSVGDSGVLTWSGPGGAYVASRVGGAPLVIATGVLPEAQVQTTYAQQLVAAGGVPPYQWRVEGELPRGLELNSSTGMLGGVPEDAGSFNLHIVVTDSADGRAEQIFPLEILLTALRISTMDLPPATTGEPYTAVLTATGGTPPYQWSLVEGSLPEGLMLEDNIIQGIASEPASAEVTFQVTDSASEPGVSSASFTLRVVEPDQTNLEASVAAVVSGGAILRYRAVGPPAQPCFTRLSTDAAFLNVVSTVTDTGRGRREIVLGQGSPLTPGTQYWAEVSCGAVRAARTFRTPPWRANSTVQLPLGVPPMTRREAAEVEVAFGPTPALGSAKTQPCPGGCAIKIPALSDSITYFRLTYLDGGGQPLGSSDIRAVAIP